MDVSNGINLVTHFQNLFYNLFWKSSRQVISQAQDILTQWVFILFQFFLYLFFMNREIGSIKSFFGLCLLMLLGSFCCCKLSTHLSHLQSGKQMSQHLCFVWYFMTIKMFQQTKLRANLSILTVRFHCIKFLKFILVGTLGYFRFPHTELFSKVK